jgi:hypothetical protein
MVSVHQDVPSQTQSSIGINLLWLPSMPANSIPRKLLQYRSFRQCLSVVPATCLCTIAVGMIAQQLWPILIKAGHSLCTWLSSKADVLYGGVVPTCLSFDIIVQSWRIRIDRTSARQMLRWLYPREATQMVCSPGAGENFGSTWLRTRTSSSNRYRATNKIRYETLGRACLAASHDTVPNTKPEKPGDSNDQPTQVECHHPFLRVM